MASTHRAPIEEHPDLVELRARHERAAATPRAQVIEALALITGLYLAASPWIAGFNGFTTLAVNNLIAGIAYMLLLGGLGTSYERTHSMAWAAAAIGIWTCVAPWVVAGDVAHTRSIANAAPRSTEFSSMGLGDGFQWIAFRQRSCDIADAGRGDVVWDRQRACPI